MNSTQIKQKNFWFRFKKEIIAYEKQFEYLKKNKATINLENIARHFSSTTYLWSKKYEDARKELQKLWNKS